MVKEKWLVQSKKADFNEIASKYNILPVTARLIRNRDIVEDNEINMYLNGSLGELHSPRLLKDMDKAVAIICDKLTQEVRFRVIGDYDIDGVCAGNILVRGMKMLGANVDFEVPDRVVDGYGINQRIINDAHRDGIDTIITCDNGIAAWDAIEGAKECGMTIIVTDHHEVPEKKVPADAVIDPKQKDCPYPYKDICGAVVAYKLIQALFEEMNRDISEIKYLLELAAIATIGDVVNLQDENRIIAKTGLQLIDNSRIPGVRALKKVCCLENSEINSYHIGFKMGPCLNAGGRLDTAMKSYRLLALEEDEAADLLAEELYNLNEERKEMTIKNTEIAMEMIENDPEYEQETILVVFLPDCHESLAGIVAGRIREKYNKPVFAITRSGELLKGSGRSIEGYNMFEELTKCSDLLVKFGGHEMAAGLSLLESNLMPLRKTLNKNSTLTEEDLICKVWIDVAMPFQYISERLVQELKMLEPFGKANPKPVFADKNIRIKRITVFGKDRNVIRLNMINEGNFNMEGTVFMGEEEFTKLMEDKYGSEEVQNAFSGRENNIKLGITYYPEVSEYRGNMYMRVVIGKIM